MHRRSKLPQGPRNIMEVFLKAQIISYHGSICLLACPNPHSTTCPCSSPSTGCSTRVTPYTLPSPTPSHPLSPLHPPISFSLPPSPTSAAAAPFSHATLPAPSTFPSRMTSPAVNSHHLFDHALSQDMRLV